MFACLRAAIPADAGAASWCDKGIIGTDGDEYTAEIFDSDRLGSCIWFEEAPPCAANAIAVHGAFR